MVRCFYCGDEHVTPQGPTFAELVGEKVRVYREYLCDICKLKWKEEERGETRVYRLDDQGRTY